MKTPLYGMHTNLCKAKLHLKTAFLLGPCSQQKPSSSAYNSMPYRAGDGCSVISPDQSAGVHSIQIQLQIVSQVFPKGLGLLCAFGGEGGVG
jgi:hypothetical protein